MWLCPMVPHQFSFTPILLISQFRVSRIRSDSPALIFRQSGFHRQSHSYSTDVFCSVPLGSCLSRVSAAAGAKPVLLMFSAGQICFPLRCFCRCKLTAAAGACSAWFGRRRWLTTALFQSSSSWFGLPLGADRLPQVQIFVARPPPSSDFCRLQAKARCLVSFRRWSSVQ
jgi:hypothetical protein